MTAGFPLRVEPGYRVGRWVVEGPLGAGAFASVYAARRAEDPPEPENTAETEEPEDREEPEKPEPGPSAEGPGDEVALKFLPTGTCTPRGLRHLKDLVEREVELLSRLRAPRLIRLYETLTVDDPADPELDGATVLVLERADRSLQSLLGASGTESGIDTAPGLLTEICEGLHQLHGAGWVHGDLKPGNVLLMPDGTVRLGDFSTAGELEGTHAYGPGFGTPDYTPPELLWPEMGARGTQVRPSSDIWAFGVLAHLVLTGVHPFPGGTPAARRDAAVRYARGTDDLRLSPTLPKPWHAIVADCLSRTHETRVPHDATLLLERVRQAAAGEIPRQRPWPVRHLLLSTGLLASGTALGLVAGLFVWGRGGTDPGYERCAPGAVCFFSRPDGKGDICLWQGSSADWRKTEARRCPWLTTGTVRSVFNNGFGPEEGTPVPDLNYFAEPGRKRLLGCLAQGTRLNFAEPTRPLSHEWIKRCTAPSEIRVTA